MYREFTVFDLDPAKRKLVESLSESADVELLPYSNELSYEWISEGKSVRFTMIDTALKDIAAGLAWELSDDSHVNGTPGLANERRFFVRVNNEFLDIRDPNFDRVKAELPYSELTDERQFLSTARRMHDSLLNRRIACHARSFSLLLATPAGEG
jgi:hypothetical protein